MLHQKNRRQNVWGILGGKFHDKLEEITLGKADKSELKPLVTQELENLEIIGVDFPKDSRGNDTIKHNWITNMRHFSNNFEPLTGEFETEELLIYKLDEDHYLQGYADLIKYNDDGTCSILDWKSSSLYSAKDFEHAAHQLRIYGLAKEQSDNVTVRDLSWIFMKYVEVQYIGKKRKNSSKEEPISKVIERRKIAKEMQDLIEGDLRACGYEDMDIDMYIGEMLKGNSLEGLPKPIRDKYTIKTYIKTIPFQGDIKGQKKTLEYIRETINEFESRDEKKEEDWEPREFTQTTKTGNVKEDTFFCNALCDFGATCKYLQIFNDTKSLVNDEIDEWF